jgi:GNAT superfamily N-acetyltransferase
MDWAVRDATCAPAAVDAVRSLFREYGEWLGDVVCAVGLEEEIAALPGPYAEPAGRLLLVVDGYGADVGCAAVREHAAGVAEIKRLYVRPEARGTGVGRALARAALEAAADLGYEKVRVTTIPAMMERAARMYEDLGFREVEPFHDYSRVADGVAVTFLERDL